jgi:vacuolar-type H+-ATPase subunit H
VPNLRDFLSRFRPAGAPGAGRAAVPADRHRELESELSAVLTLLDGPGAECADIVNDARQDAEQIIAAARAEAADIVAAARRRATAEADRIVQDAVSAAESDAAKIKAAGAAEADLIRRRARDRLPMLADRAVAMVRELAEPRTQA